MNPIKCHCSIKEWISLVILHISFQNFTVISHSVKRSLVLDLCLLLFLCRSSRRSLGGKWPSHGLIIFIFSHMNNHTRGKRQGRIQPATQTLFSPKTIITAKRRTDLTWKLPSTMMEKFEGFHVKSSKEKLEKKENIQSIIQLSDIRFVAYFSILTFDDP